MTKALADRLAEAFAEVLHTEVRKELWGYAPDEKLSATDMHKIKYQVRKEIEKNGKEKRKEWKKEKSKKRKNEGREE